MTLKRFFSGRKDVVVLKIDAAKVSITHAVRFEGAPLNLDNFLN